MIVHVGLGGFARAHLGEYTADAGGWEIWGVAPRSRTVVDALRSRGHRYTLIIRDAHDMRRELGVFTRACTRRRSARRCSTRSPTAEIVTLTVTEKAYRTGRAGDGAAA